MKIFVSYARVDKPFCIRIIETLHAHEVWYDQRLYAGQDWWKEILRRLDWCEVFVFLLSPDSVASLYCRRELALALRLKRDIIPVLINRDTVLPETMKDWQYVDLCDNLTVENISHLLNAILLVERQRAALTQAPIVAEEEKTNPAPATSPASIIGDGVRALENGEFDRAVTLLKQAKASGYESRFVRLDKLLRIAESALSEKSQTRELEREYQAIAALFAFESMRQMACDALHEFRQEFGDYDPQDLRRHCEAHSNEIGSATANAIPPPNQGRLVPASIPAQPNPASERKAPLAPLTSQAVPTTSATAPLAEPALERPAARSQAATTRRSADHADAPLTVNEVLPMLQWCDIPHGNVTISSIVGEDEDFGEMTVPVDSFVMSKYPVTNAQFAIFARAEDGYRNPRWWSFSPHAQRWFQLGKGVAQSRFDGSDLPRENVNWYEAMAFANWLGSLLKMKATLPTLAQWQRAAKGDDDRYYPWGDNYHEDHCNTLETGLKTTTPVNRYRLGVSPYGVYDMAGNIWEWTMNKAALANTGRDHRRAVAGGSFVSPCDRAQSAFRHYLDPRVRYSSIGIRLVGLT